MKKCWILFSVFLCLLRELCGFVFYSINVIACINSFGDDKPTFQPWEKFHLVMVHNAFTCRLYIGFHALHRVVVFSAG